MKGFICQTSEFTACPDIACAPRRALSGVHADHELGVRTGPLQHRRRLRHGHGVLLPGRDEWMLHARRPALRRRRRVPSGSRGRCGQLHEHDHHGQIVRASLRPAVYGQRRLRRRLHLRPRSRVRVFGVCRRRPWWVRPRRAAAVDAGRSRARDGCRHHGAELLVHQPADLALRGELIDCTVASDCPAQWSCLEPPSAATGCSVSRSADGSTTSDCVQTPVQNVCQPPYSDLGVGQSFNGARRVARPRARRRRRATPPRARARPRKPRRKTVARWARVPST